MRKDQQMKLAQVSIAAVVLVVLLAPVAGAQVFYSYPGAPPIKPDQPALGSNVGFGDDLFRVLGYGRFNVHSASDLGLELVFDKADSPVEANVWRWGFGADYKYAIVPSDSSSMPFDLAVNAGFGYQNGGDAWNIRFPVGGLVSRSLAVRTDQSLVPFGGVYILFDYASWNLPAGASGDNSDFEVDVELRAGAAYEITKTAMAYATLFLGAGTKLYLGVNFLL
jgi:hypothetical protein